MIIFKYPIIILIMIRQPSYLLRILSFYAAGIKPMYFMSSQKEQQQQRFPYQFRRKDITISQDMEANQQRSKWFKQIFDKTPQQYFIPFYRDYLQAIATRNNQFLQFFTSKQLLAKINKREFEVKVINKDTPVQVILSKGQLVLNLDPQPIKHIEVELKRGYEQLNIKDVLDIYYNPKIPFFHLINLYTLDVHFKSKIKLIKLDQEDKINEHQFQQEEVHSFKIQRFNDQSTVYQIVLKPLINKIRHCFNKQKYKSEFLKLKVGANNQYLQWKVVSLDKQS